jgi:hypothetical protein
MITLGIYEKMTTIQRSALFVYVGNSTEYNFPLLGKLEMDMGSQDLIRIAEAAFWVSDQRPYHIPGLFEDTFNKDKWPEGLSEKKGKCKPCDKPAGDGH